MMNEENDIELLEKYLHDELSVEERSILEQRLQQEPDLQQLLGDLKLLTASVRQSARADLKKDLVIIESGLPKIAEGKTVPWRTTWVVGIAASLALIISVLYIGWPTQTTNEELFAQYFEPYPNVIMPTVRGDLEADTTLIAKAYRAYDQGEYEEVISLFEQVAEKDEGVYLYLGNSYLATNNPEKAISYFEKVLNDYDVFDEQAEWYLGIAYLKVNNRQKAIERLKLLSTQKSTYALRATQLLKTIQ